MRACRPTRFSGGMARIGGVFGRIYNPPLHARTAVSRCRGALYMRPDCTAGPPQACEETELPYGRPYRPPLRSVFYLVRRAGCPHPAKPGRRDHRVFDCCGPVMAACGHAALQGSAGAWRESGAFSGGYIIRPYMHALPFPAVGAHFICARTAPPVRRRLARKRSCPAGGHKGRPYAVVLTWCVWRGAHTPPNRAAGTTRAPGRRGPVRAA